ncbi:MAG TPA: ferredoxin reductase, partial [Nakamurella sp.]
MTTVTGGNGRDPGVPGRLRRRLWGLAEAMASPRRPEDYLDMFHPLRRGADLRGRVIAVRPEAGGAVTVVLRPGAAWRSHVPGQYARVGLEVDGVRRWRSYSITSPPAPAGGTISITARAVPGGIVSAHLAQRLAEGDLVHLDQACGDFVLPDPIPDKVLFITGGSGITPVIGMLRSGRDWLRDVVLVHSEGRDRDVIFGPELRGLAADGHIRLVEQHTERAGRLGMAELRALVPDLAERAAWACGPAGLLDEIEAYWDDLGTTRPLHTERFRTALAAPGQGGTVEFTTTGATV